MAPRDVSGRYRGSRHGFEVRLRIDVDGPRPMNCISADYYRVSGRKTNHVGSMRVDAPVVKVNALQIVITGTGVFSMPTKCKRVEVTIPRVSLGSVPAPATLQHVAAPRAPGTAYECRFESASFRIVELEEAREKGVEPFEAYDTASLASGGTPRTLTHVEAFAEAGIEMLSTRPPTVIDTSAAGGNATWSDAELHAAMREHFSRWGDRPRWAIWLMHAAFHDDERVGGLMFDQRGLQRQGCAVFYGHAPDISHEIQRDRLHTCVHELGHGFNLSHSWQKSLTEPPLPSCADARSWMNYPDRYPGGPAAYWEAFDFGFDDFELMHLRHAFEPHVIMGGKPFASGTREGAPGWDVEEPQDPGLRLKLSAPHALVQDVPVTVGFELSATTRQSRPVPPILGPRPGNVDIAIRAPSGTEFIFEPLLHHCRGDQMIMLRAGDRPVRDHAFIHYGKGGYAFDRPGRYLVRARYAPPDGPVVLSNVASIRVMAPISRADGHVAEMIAGDEQVGTLMSLMGSDARALQRGNNRLTEIIGRYPTHPVASVARLVRAANLARGFKRVDLDGRVSAREPRIQDAAALVADLVQHEPLQFAETGAPDEAGRRARKGALGPIRIRQGVDPAVGGFVDSRSREISAAVSAGVASALGGAGVLDETGPLTFLPADR